MPSIATITVKKNDGSTDIAYTGVQPSSGDGSQAIWKAQAVGSAPAHRPELRLSAKDGTNGRTRVLKATYRYPQIATNTTTSITSVVDSASCSVTWEIPKAMAQTDIDEFASQLANLVDSTLVVDCVKAGFSAS